MTAQDHLDPSTKHKLTVQEYLLLAGEGAFADRHTELLDGEIYYMSPKHRPHARVLTQVIIALDKALEGRGNRLGLLTDVSVHISDHDMPNPDIVITDAPGGAGILPIKAVRLVVEVSDATLSKDLGFKEALYARAGVPEYWVVDITGDRVLCHANPRSDADGGGYDGQLDLPFGEALMSATIPGLVVETAGWG